MNTPIFKGKCGTDCSDCQFREQFHCGGCPQQEGRIFWGECDIYRCAAEKGFVHCGQCEQLPCRKLTEFIENGHNPHRMDNLLRWRKEEKQN